MVAPGAQNLVKTLDATGQMPPKTAVVTELTMDHWILIANVFENWAFRPQVRSLARSLIVCIRLTRLPMRADAV